MLAATVDPATLASASISRPFGPDAPPEPEWDYDFLGTGRPDLVYGRGRKYFKALTMRRAADGLERICNVGDSVVLNSGGGEPWVAQVVELFEETPAEHAARPDDDDPEDFCLMRCTLRWYQSPTDISREALSVSRMPPPLAAELYLSDHVEDDGFNCVTEIAGMAFPLDSINTMQLFEEEPDPRYIPELDKVCIVRGFANSSVNNVVRPLDFGELHKILKNPTTDRNLHDNSLWLNYDG